MKKKTIVIVMGITIIVGYLFYQLADLFAPGSYPYAEEYELNMSDSELIKKIIGFKNRNPQFIVPNTAELIDGKGSPNDLWYYVYFYYPVENEIIFTWVRSANENKSTFALVGVLEGKSIYNNRFQLINKNLMSDENKEQKRKFKERILDKLLVSQ